MEFYNWTCRYEVVVYPSTKHEHNSVQGCGSLQGLEARGSGVGVQAISRTNIA